MGVFVVCCIIGCIVIAAVANETSLIVIVGVCAGMPVLGIIMFTWKIRQANDFFHIRDDIGLYSPVLSIAWF